METTWISRKDEINVPYKSSKYLYNGFYNYFGVLTREQANLVSKKEAQVLKISFNHEEIISNLEEIVNIKNNLTGIISHLFNFQKVRVLHDGFPDLNIWEFSPYVEIKDDLFPVVINNGAYAKNFEILNPENHRKLTFITGNPLVWMDFPDLFNYHGMAFAGPEDLERDEYLVKRVLFKVIQRKEEGIKVHNKSPYITEDFPKNIISENGLYIYYKD